MTDEQTIRAALPFDRYPALDRLVAERDALRARVDEAVADEPRDADLLAAALARAEGAEKERDEALSRAACQLEGSIRLKAAAAARCATLEAALREIADQGWVARPDGSRPAWLLEQSPFWNYLTPEEIARDALVAATPPAEWCPTCGTTPCPDCQPAEEEA